jgi:hypothetical protein
MPAFATRSWRHFRSIVDRRVKDRVDHTYDLRQFDEIATAHRRDDGLKIVPLLIPIIEQATLLLLGYE